MRIKIKDTNAIRLICDDLLARYRQARGKQSGWEVYAGMQKLCAHDNKLYSDVLYVANIALYLSGIPKAGRHGVLLSIRDELTKIETGGKK